MTLFTAGPPDQPLASCLPVVVARLRQHVADLQTGQVPLAALLISQNLSRELAAYRVPSPATRAARQLEQACQTLRPGQRMRFLNTRGEPGVMAWDGSGTLPAVTAADRERYIRLLPRAAGTVLSPLGIGAAEIWWQVSGWGQQLPLPSPGMALQQSCRQHIPTDLMLSQ